MNKSKPLSKRVIDYVSSRVYEGTRPCDHEGEEMKKAGREAFKRAKATSDSGTTKEQRV